MGRSIVQKLPLSEEQNVYLEFMGYVHAIGVCYAVLHGWEALIEGKVTDIDMVVAANDIARLETAIRNRYEVLNVLQYAATGVGLILIPKDGNSVSAFIVDLTTDYRWRGRIFFTGEELLRDRREWQGFWIVGRRQEFAYLTVKKIYEKCTIPPNQRSRLKQLVSDLGGEATSILQQLFGDFYGPEVIQWIIDESWEILESHVDELHRALRHELLKRDFSNSLRYWVAEARRSWRRWRYPTGLWVALVGPEGGTTAALTLKLTQAFLGPFRAAKVLSELRKPIPRAKRGVHIPKREPIGICQCLASNVFVHVFRFLFNIRPPLVRSALIVLNCRDDDRPLKAAASRQTLVRRLAHRIIPRPDLVFVLDRIDRHASRPATQCTAQSDKQPFFGTWSASKNVVVLGPCSLPEAAEIVCQTISQYLVARSLKRRHIWFSN